MKRSNVTWEIVDKVRYLIQKGYLDGFNTSDSEVFERQMRDKIHGILLSNSDALNKQAEKTKNVKFIVDAYKTIGEQNIGFGINSTFNLDTYQVTIVGLSVTIPETAPRYFKVDFANVLPNPEKAFQLASSTILKKANTNSHIKKQDPPGKNRPSW